ncbi:TPA: hypothetical protein H1009_00090 [archaeon]|nr:hypothetical protein [Candidatus Naiadarchaeales archaeon SRR2090153.bin461]
MKKKTKEEVIENNIEDSKEKTAEELLKLIANGKIVVGQNGRIWIDGENPNIAIEAIKLIEAEAHTQGLTERVKIFLEKKTNKKIAEVPLIEDTVQQRGEME